MTREIVPLYPPHACAWCAHLTTRHGERCALDNGAINMAWGTCAAWVLDPPTVFTYSSAHEKAAALVLKQRTYHEVLLGETRRA